MQLHLLSLPASCFSDGPFMGVVNALLCLLLSMLVAYSVWLFLDNSTECLQAAGYVCHRHDPVLRLYN